MSVFFFWLLFLLSIYSYFLYPLVLAVRVSLQSRNAAATFTSELPRLSLIVTAYNEQVRIREKIENSLAIDYPRLEIIIASDCSTDDTENIVAEYSGRGVKLVRADQRLGKENAQRCAIEQASGDVVVFSDVATQIPTDALRKLAAYFADPKIGAVSSEDRFVSQDGAIAGEGAYVRYEMWLRRIESELAGLVGLSGSFFAARKTICAAWDIHCPSDFNTALNCARAGYRAVTAPDVLGYYKDLADPRKEYQRKVRTVLRGITAVARHPDVLSFASFRWFAAQVWSHKILRWGVPWFLLGLLLATFAAVSFGGIYVLALLAQLAFYGVVIAAHFNAPLREHGIVRIIYFFVQSNIAIADACVQYLLGKRMTTWQPSAR